MLHKQVEATATPTIEKGTAVLLVAAYTKDRSGDVIERGAFRSTIAAWKASAKQIPLAWNHDTGEPERLIGTVDPSSMRETRDGLLAEAHLDLDGSETARTAWRLVKSDSIGVSFGYTAETKKGENGTRLLTSIDLYEISLTATPMPGATRVVNWKGAGVDGDWEALRLLPEQPIGRMKQLNRQRDEERRQEKLIEEVAARAEAEEAKAARKARPIKVKTFNV